MVPFQLKGVFFLFFNCVRFVCKPTALLPFSFVLVCATNNRSQPAKKIKKRASRRAKEKKAKKTAKALSVSDKMENRIAKEQTDKKRKEKWKSLWT